MVNITLSIDETSSYLKNRLEKQNLSGDKKSINKVYSYLFDFKNNLLEIFAHIFQQVNALKDDILKLRNNTLEKSIVTEKIQFLEQRIDNLESQINIDYCDQNHLDNYCSIC